jgi:hypothetical protein
VTYDRSAVFSGYYFTNKTDCHDITEILLKVALKTINQTKLFITSGCTRIFEMFHDDELCPLPLAIESDVS